ncbi:MAG: alpha/beta hydrolase [Planctomycetes bacterium]|nr:alpha/beta hydrolase [Planctomycetota bacterium]
MPLSRLFAAILLCCSLVAAEPPADAGPAVEADLVYQRIGQRELRLDLCQATLGAAPRPVLVWVHGGGWRAGHRRDFREPMRNLAKLGFSGVAVEYRLSGEARHPAQIEDIAAALRWLAEEGPARGLDPGRTALVGASAGGHLVLLAGFHGQVPAGVQVRAIVNCAGPVNLPLGRSLPAGDDELRRGCGMDSQQLIAALVGSDDRAAAVYAEASPLTWVRKGVPPVLTLHGTADQLVPVAQAEALHAALRAAGASEQLIRGSGGHDVAGWPAPERDRAIMAMVGFLAQHLR